MEDVPRHRAPSAVVASLAALALAACSGQADEPAPPSTTGSSATSSTASVEPTTPSSTVEGAPAALTSAVTKRYGSPAAGEAALGRWRGDRVAVVTGKGEQKGDVTLAVLPRGKKAWVVVGGWWPSLGAKGKPDLGGRQHVLLIGSDARPGQKMSRARADALQLVGIDGKGGAGIMGFARDLWVPIPGHGHGKLNSAMVFRGPTGQVDAIEQVSGIRPKGYVLANFSGFRRAIDEAGGLKVSLPDGLRSHLDGGRLPRGVQKIDGDSALALARERKSLPDGDFGRSANQGLVVGAVAIQARLQGPSGLPRLMTILDKHTGSDLTATEMLRFSASFYRVDPRKVGRAVAKGGFGTAGGQSIVVLDERSRASFRDFRDGRLG
jgi:LCP family protein required for cell wall assembly